MSLKSVLHEALKLRPSAENCVSWRWTLTPAVSGGFKRAHVWWGMMRDCGSLGGRALSELGVHLLLLQPGAGADHRGRLLRNLFKSCTNTCSALSDWQEKLRSSWTSEERKGRNYLCLWGSFDFLRTNIISLCDR